MKNENNRREEIIKVPQDMLIDVLDILFEEGLPFEITRVQPSRGIAFMAIQIDGNVSRQEKVLQNIQDMLEEYEQYRFSEEITINWRED